MPCPLHHARVQRRGQQRPSRQHRHTAPRRGTCRACSDSGAPAREQPSTASSPLGASERGAARGTPRDPPAEAGTAPREMATLTSPRHMKKAPTYCRASASSLESRQSYRAGSERRGASRALCPTARLRPRTQAALGWAPAPGHGHRGSLGSPGHLVATFAAVAD